MQIELRHLKINEPQSGKSIAFTAELFVNGKRAGLAINNGQGGTARFDGFGLNGNFLLKEAAAWCNKLPDKSYENIKVDGKVLVMKQSLPNFVDDLLMDHIKQQSLLKFREQMVKDMDHSIVYGVADKEYQVLDMKYPLSIILADRHRAEHLQKVIREKILPILPEGHSILNTNLPAYMIKAHLNQKATKQTRKIRQKIK